MFSVFTDDFLVVPPRQIGISSATSDKELLGAIALFLGSDFAYYHQFLTSTEFGTKRDRATLSALRQIPLPISKSEDKLLAAWSQLYTRLAKTRPRHLHESDGEEKQLSLDEDDSQERLLAEVNQLVGDALGLTAREQMLIHDFVHIRLALNDGKLGHEAVSNSGTKDVRAYAARLRRELDAFTGDATDRRHAVAVIHDDLSGMIQVEFTKDRDAAKELVVHKADHPEARLLEKTRQRLREKRAQWVYFDRNLRIYEGRRTYLFKPMQRFHWTESQAMIDASQIIAETLSASPKD
jgi:hypothetical protein